MEIQKLEHVKCKKGVQKLKFFGPHPLHPSWVRFHCLRDHSQFQLPMCIMHMLHEEVAIDAFELRKLCGKSAKRQQKRLKN